MIADQTQSVNGHENLIDMVAAFRPFKSAVVVVTDNVDNAARALALHLAQRDGTRIILFDAKASSGWTSPFPPGEDIRPFLLDEAGVRRSGRDTVANAVRDLQQDGVEARAHLSSTRHAEDLRRLVEAEGIDIVICPTALDGKLVQNVHRSRRVGAHLLLCPPGEPPELFAPLQPDEAVPAEDRIQLRFLIGLLLTFLAAGLRNRSGPSSRS